MSKSLEETQERTKKNEAAIAEANQKIVQVDQKAGQAARRPPRRARRPTRRPTKAEAVDKASKRIVYEVTLSEDQGNFKFGKATLPDEAKARLDEVVQAAEGEPERRVHRGRGLHGQPRLGDLQPAARPRARRVGEALPLRGAPDPAPPHQRDQLRLGQPDRAEQDQGRPREEPPRGDQGPVSDALTIAVRAASTRPVLRSGRRSRRGRPGDPASAFWLVRRLKASGSG